MVAKADKAQVERLFTRDFLLVATMNLAIFFSFQMMTVGLPVYVSQLGAGTQIVGLVTTITVGTTIIVRIFSGPFLDRFGRIGSLISGVLIMVCAIVSYAIFPIVGVILGFRVLHGIGWGFSSNATSTLAADVIPKKRFAEGMGYFAMTNAIASALAPAVSLSLIQKADPVSMIIVSAAMALVAFLAAVVQTALSKRSPSADGADGEITDEDKAATGAGMDAAAAEVETGAAKADTAAAEENGLENVKGLDTFLERRAMLPGLLMLLVDVGFGAITTFIALHGAAQGVENVSVYFVMYAILTLVGRPPIGKFIDRFGYRIPAIFSGICTAGTLAFIAISNNTFMFAIAGALAGLGIGSAMGTFQTMAVASVEPWRRGVATSTYLTFLDGGIASGSFISGLVAAAVGYKNMYFIIALFPLLTSLIAAVFIKKGVEER